MTEAQTRGSPSRYVIDYPLCNDALQTCNQPQLVIPPLQTAFLIQAWKRGQTTDRGAATSARAGEAEDASMTEAQTRGSPS
jgi:hypothetical protein